MRVHDRRHDPVAAHELAFCLELLPSLLREVDGDAELRHLIEQAINLGELCNPASAEAVELMRAKLLDIAATIAIRPIP